MFCTANTDVEQRLIRLRKFDKVERLKEVVGELLREKQAKILIFTSRKKTADFLGGVLSEALPQGVRATTIHGDREQREREIALGDFRSGRMPILVSSDVLARGIDIKEIDHVINFDMPKDIDQYVHRIGRTGRVGHQVITALLLFVFSARHKRVT